MLVYVDDIIVTRDDLEEQKQLKENQSKAFEIKDLGVLRYFLGIEVAYSKAEIFLSQRKHILDLLNETRLLGGKGAGTPIESNVKLEENSNYLPVDKGRYQRLVGRLVYLSHIKPDIGFTVSLVSQFMHCPTKEHIQTVRRILCYLKTTPDKGILFRPRNKLDVIGYTDANYGGFLIDRRSITSYYVFLGGNLVS